MEEKTIQKQERIIRIAKDEKGLKMADDLFVKSLSIVTETGSILNDTKYTEGYFVKPLKDDLFERLIERYSKDFGSKTFTLGIFPQGFGKDKDVLVIKDVYFSRWITNIEYDTVIETVDWTGSGIVLKKCEDIGYRKKEV